MYVIRRVYDVKPGMARKVATLLQQQGDAYSAAGQRGEVTVYFNGGTVPGDNNKVYMQWNDDTIDSPYREGLTLAPEAMANPYRSYAGRPLYLRLRAVKSRVSILLPGSIWRSCTLASCPL